jgi:hypothetical protein
MLMRELNQVTYVQEEAKNKFEKDVHDLESKLNTLVSNRPHEYFQMPRRIINFHAMFIGDRF